MRLEARKPATSHLKTSTNLAAVIAEAKAEAGKLRAQCAAPSSTRRLTESELEVCVDAASLELETPRAGEAA